MPPEMFNTVHECTKADAIKRIEDTCLRILNLLNPQERPEDGLIVKVNALWEDRITIRRESKDTKNVVWRTVLSHAATGILTILAVKYSKFLGL